MRRNTALLCFCFVVVTFLLFPKHSLLNIVMVLLLVLLGGAYCNNISCVGDNECYGKTLNCSDDGECNVLCSGNYACNEATINGGKATTLSVICDGYYACLETIINGGNASALSVMCNNVSDSVCAHAVINGQHTGSLTVGGSDGIEAGLKLSSASITCPNNAICNITCSTFEGCWNTTINATLSTALYLYVLAYDPMVMKESQIYCPNDGLYGNTNNCNFLIDVIWTLQTWIDSEIYAIEGMNDIYFSCTDTCFPEVEYQPTIYCTEDFSASCEVSTFNKQSEAGCRDPNSTCSTYFIPTHNPTNPTNGPTTDPTVEPTLEPTLEPTVEPTNNPTFTTEGNILSHTKAKASDYIIWFIIGGVCIVFGLCLLVLIWYCIKIKQREMANVDEMDQVMDNKNVAIGEDKALIMKQYEVENRLDLGKFRVDEDDHKEMLQLKKNISMSVGLKAD